MNTESMALGNYRFLAYMIIESSGSYVVVIPLYNVLKSMMGRVI